ncbi:hypothetical protein JX266_009105 [Neoarthrinium moseri]|nr:hypothetical protein JX266_009105 [Neoarthrinium moseri]
MLRRPGLLAFIATVGVFYLIVWHLLLREEHADVSACGTSRHPWSKGGLKGILGIGTKKRPDHDGHPISELIDGAFTSLSHLLCERSFSLEQAADRYRKRRGRHPPPGFDKWFEAAKAADAIVVEEFFDRIHHDINPFWAVDPLELRRQAHSQPQLIRVRHGEAFFETDTLNRPEFIQLWTKLVQEIMPHLPDLDMVVNVMDETRVLVPWEDMTRHFAAEQESRNLFPISEAVNEYTDYAEFDKPGYSGASEPHWIGGRQHEYWDFLAAACPPDSPARKFTRLSNFSSPIDEIFPTDTQPYTYKGFVNNVTAASDPCQQPHLRGMHGTFVESISMSTTTTLFPMFGGSKLPQNNEILIPGGMYLTDREFYSGGDTHGPPWRQKMDKVVWRGVASGGRNKEDNWWHYQRHRFVQMMNGTTVGRVENGEPEAAPSFILPPPTYSSGLQQPKGTLGPWLSTFTNVSFVHMECFPPIYDAEGRYLPDCQHTDPYMRVNAPVPMKEQYKFKFLPDVDGNSYSARWRGFLLSTSCPLKATIYAEWHDDRLFPWLHYVPFDNTFTDIYAIMDYFLNGHDAEARFIAEEGKQWAEKVLRREDMRLYVWRLLLEYARVVDPQRDRLGFVTDMVSRS